MSAVTAEQLAEVRTLLAGAVDGDDKDTRRVLDHVPVLVAEVERLWERLECAHAYKSVDGKMVRIAVEVGSLPDGIECRDETIRLHDRHIDELRAELRSVKPAMQAEQRRHARARQDLHSAKREVERLRGLLRRALPSVEADGTHDGMAHLNEARDAALAEIG